MYESFYGLRERPFSILPNPDFLYFSHAHRVAYGLLEYGLTQQAGFVVITGPIGTGKTTLIRYLISHLGADVTVGLLANTHVGFDSLLDWITDAFDVECEGRRQTDLYRALSRFLHSESERGRRALLIVDEAQNLTPERLEELRTLSNLNLTAQILQIVLVGQSGLRETLRRPDMEQLAQRVVVDYHLQPLTREETDVYIAHRLGVAGGTNTQLFASSAVDRIYRHTGGVPRVINILCESALVYGYALQKQRIDAGLIDEAALDRTQGGVLPLAGEQSVSR
jgi:type II secretory pathway predicted ATPase ExeA